MTWSVHDFFLCGSALKRSEDFHFICFYKKKKKNTENKNKKTHPLLGISFLLFACKKLASQTQLNLISGFGYLLKLDDFVHLSLFKGKGGVFWQL